MKAFNGLEDHFNREFDLRRCDQLGNFGGYFFGNIPVIRNNFSFVVLAIIIISVMPAVVEYMRHRAEAKPKPAL